MTVPNLALNNGYTIPQLGFGVFKIVPGETAAAVREAIGEDTWIIGEVVPGTSGSRASVRLD